ncbi:MAG TPA: YlbF family regulator [Longimicrobiaceae bacterium]|nr:YlbF family regulator [Longimicrobiaceae bacterium]
MEAIQEKAREIGRLLSQTDEYKALKRANERLSEDRETVTLLNELGALQDRLSNELREGKEPSAENQEEYGRLADQLQQRTAYQGVVAAQSNFDNIMVRMNEDIARGIEAGEQSRIILSS